MPCIGVGGDRCCCPVSVNSESHSHLARNANCPTSKYATLDDNNTHKLHEQRRLMVIIPISCQLCIKEQFELKSLAWTRIPLPLLAIMVRVVFL